MGKETLLSKLGAYAQSDFYPLHMPGHKRNLETPEPQGAGRTLAEAAALDITEIDGFDNLHEPEGILREAMERAARLYGADHTFYSVNGSTAGLLTAISAAVPEGGTLIMARNCHKAVYHGVYLRKLRPVYLYPETIGGLNIADAITPKQVEEALLQHPEAAAVLLTSPTYDGVTADVERIARIVHRYDIPLIVDAAHGAHFGFHPAFPDSPVHLGADLTVVSLHKTMPCMTQTALLHVRGSRVDLNRIRLFEGIYQTSSPSYFLMAGMDNCVRAAQEKGADLWDSFFRDREDFLTEVKKLSCLRVITAGMPPFLDGGYEDKEAGGRRMDPGKILIDTSRAGLTGKELYDIFIERYHLQPEMVAGNYVTAIMTCCDRREGWQRLSAALYEIDRACRRRMECGSAGAAASGFSGKCDEQAGAAASGISGKCDEQAGAASGISGKCDEQADAASGTGMNRSGLTGAQNRQPEKVGLYPRLEAACSLDDALDADTEAVPLEAAAGKASGAFINLYPPGIPLAVPGERLSKELTELLKSYIRQKLPLCGIREDAVIVLKNV